MAYTKNINVSGKTFPITYNLNGQCGDSVVSFESDKNWATIESSGDNQINVIVDGNYTSSDRTCTITPSVNGVGCSEKIIQITQEHCTCENIEINESGTVVGGYVVINRASGSYKIGTYNCTEGCDDFSFLTQVYPDEPDGDVSWVTNNTANEGSILITVEENTNANSREGIISLSARSSNYDADCFNLQDIYFKQLGNECDCANLNITHVTTSIPSSGGNFTFLNYEFNDPTCDNAVFSNWKFIEKLTESSPKYVNWLHFVSASNGVVTLSADSVSDGCNRECTVYYNVSAKGSQCLISPTLVGGQEMSDGEMITQSGVSCGCNALTFIPVSEQVAQTACCSVGCDITLGTYSIVSCCTINNISFTAYANSAGTATVDWVSGITYSNGEIKCVLQQNNGNSSRNAWIKLNFTTNNGSVCSSNRLPITQSSGGEIWFTDANGNTITNLTWECGDMSEKRVNINNATIQEIALTGVSTGFSVVNHQTYFTVQPEQVVFNNVSAAIYIVYQPFCGSATYTTFDITQNACTPCEFTPVTDSIISAECSSGSTVVLGRFANNCTLGNYYSYTAYTNSSCTTVAPNYVSALYLDYTTRDLICMLKENTDSDFRNIYLKLAINGSVLSKTYHIMQLNASRVWLRDENGNDVTEFVWNCGDSSTKILSCGTSVFNQLPSVSNFTVAWHDEVSHHSIEIQPINSFPLSNVSTSMTLYCTSSCGSGVTSTFNLRQNKCSTCEYVKVNDSAFSAECSSGSYVVLGQFVGGNCAIGEYSYTTNSGNMISNLVVDETTRELRCVLSDNSNNNERNCTLTYTVNGTTYPSVTIFQANPGTLVFRDSNYKAISQLQWDYGDNSLKSVYCDSGSSFSSFTSVSNFTAMKIDNHEIRIQPKVDKPNVNYNNNLSVTGKSSCDESTSASLLLTQIGCTLSSNTQTLTWECGSTGEKQAKVKNSNGTSLNISVVISGDASNHFGYSVSGGTTKTITFAANTVNTSSSYYNATAIVNDANKEGCQLLIPLVQEPICNNRTIYYTGATASVRENSFFGVNGQPLTVVSNKTAAGRGILIFDGDIVSIGDDSNSIFTNINQIPYITLPNSVETINSNAFDSMFST